MDSCLLESEGDTEDDESDGTVELFSASLVVTRSFTDARVNEPSPTLTASR